MDTLCAVALWGALVGIGVLAMARRPRPTVWTRAMLHPVLVVLAALFAALTGLSQTGILGALVILAASAIVIVRPRDFLILFGRADVPEVVGRSLDRVGVPYNREGHRFVVSRPELVIRLVSLPARCHWVAFSTRVLTPKAGLIHQVVRKSLSN